MVSMSMMSQCHSLNQATKNNKKYYQKNASMNNILETNHINFKHVIIIEFHSKSCTAESLDIK